MTTTYIFGTRDAPLKSVGKTTKECLSKIKKHYLDEVAATSLKELDELRNQTALSGTVYDSWLYNELVEEYQETVTDIESAKSITSLLAALNKNIDENIEIVEEKFNKK